MDDVRRRLKPGGVFVMYNFFRQGWIVSRLQNSVRAAFGSDALVLNLPSRDTLQADENLGGAFTMLIAGATDRIRDAFARHTEYWIANEAPLDWNAANGFTAAPRRREEGAWQQFRLTRVDARIGAATARHR